MGVRFEPVRTGVTRATAQTGEVRKPEKAPELTTPLAPSTGNAAPVARIAPPGAGAKHFDRDVLIVGAGPAGLMTAVLLRTYGVPADRIQVVDAKPEPNKTLTKASGIQPGSFPILRQAGVYETFAKEAAKVSDIEMHGAAKQDLLLIDGKKEGVPPLFAIPQFRTEEILRTRLEELGVKVKWGTTLDSLEMADDGAVAKLSGKPLSARWVIGADGLRSAVRTQLGIDFEGKQLPRMFGVVDAPIEWDRPQGRMHFFMGEGSSVILVPLPKEGWYRVLAELPEGFDPSDEARGKRPQIIKDLLERVGAKADPATIEKLHLAAFNVDERLAESYDKGHGFLVGDAAHVHSPTGGEGMNTGLGDAQNLAWKLARVIDGSAKESLLSTYEEERRPVAQKMVKDTGFATRFIGATGFLGKLRNWLLPHAGGFAGDIARTMAQLDVAYAHGLVKTDGAANGLKAGSRAPLDVAVKVYEGGALVERKLGDVLGGGEQAADRVILFDNASRKILLRKELSRALEVIGKRPHVESLVVVDSPDEARQMSVALEATKRDANVRILVDDGTLRAAYHTTQEGLFVVRPDGFLGYRSEHLDGKKLLDDYLRPSALYPRSR